MPYQVRSLLLAAALVVPAGCGSDEAAPSGALDASSSDGDASAPSDATPDGAPEVGPDAANDGAVAKCGNGQCDSSEDCSTCEADCGECPQGAMKSSVSQYGITWTFDKEYPCGQFATGDFWCVGPLVVTSVSPAPTGERNGSMVDPVGAQAYDARAGNYDAAKAVSFPLSLSPVQSLVSSISQPEASACTQGSSPGWLTYDGECQRGPINTQAILTTLSAAPATGTFRPPYAGEDKPLHRLAEIDWSALPRLPVPASAPSATEVLRHVERPWIDHLNSWTMQHGCATQNMYCYGREIGNVVATVSQFVLLDTPERDTLAARFIQLGIDNYGVLQAGGGWGVNGGHVNGRKWPIVFAGALLGNAGMKSPGLEIGNEDQMTYFGSNGKGLWGRDCNDCYFANGCKYEGSCTGGAKDCRDPAGLVDGCGDYRNCCTSVTWVGTSLAALIMKRKSDWGNDAFFDYMDRWMGGDVPGGGTSTSAFVTDMWTTYRNSLPEL